MNNHQRSALLKKALKTGMTLHVWRNNEFTSILNISRLTAFNVFFEENTLPFYGRITFLQLGEMMGRREYLIKMFDGLEEVQLRPNNTLL